MRITWKKKNVVYRCDLCETLIKYGDSYYVDWDLEAGKSESYHWECYDKNTTFWASFSQFWKSLGNTIKLREDWWKNFCGFWKRLTMTIEEMNKSISKLQTILDESLNYFSPGPALGLGSPLVEVQPHSEWEKKHKWVKEHHKNHFNPSDKKHYYGVLGEIMGVVFKCLMQELPIATARSLMLDLD